MHSSFTRIYPIKISLIGYYFDIRFIGVKMFILLLNSDGTPVLGTNTNGSPRLKACKLVFTIWVWFLQRLSAPLYYNFDFSSTRGNFVTYSREGGGERGRV